MSAGTRVAYGTDLNPSGVMNIFGARPGTPSMHGYEGFARENMTSVILSFETSHDALQQVIVPQPLEVDRDAPPILTVQAFTSPLFRGRDGRHLPYTGYAFFAPTRYKDLRAVSGWEFMDGAGHDKTIADMMSAAGLVTGMLKKLGDIRFWVNGRENLGDLSTVQPGDEVRVTVDRRGIRISGMRVRVGEEIKDLEEAVGVYSVLGVREFPTVDYKGYVDRAITAFAEPNKLPRKAFAAEPLSIEFGESEHESLDLLPIGRLVHAGIKIQDGTKESMSEARVVDQLPLTL